MLFFQFRQARNLCRADRNSMNSRKIEFEFLMRKSHFSDRLGMGFEIPAYEKNRLFKVKSVVGFYREPLKLAKGTGGVVGILPILSHPECGMCRHDHQSKPETM